jgi:hypothetical protein
VSVDQSSLDWLAARLAIAVYDTNKESPEMAMWELKQAFPGLQTISTTPSGNQIFHFPDRDLEVGPMASNSEIAVALNNPFIKTENTKLSISGYEPGAIRARLDALKKSGKDRRDQAIAKLDEAGKKHEAVSEEIERVAGQLEKEADAALQEFAEFSNGGPA